MTNKERKLRELLERFNSLPDDAVAATKLTAAFLGLSERTVRYHPHLARHWISKQRYGQRVGDARRLARKGMPKEAV